MPSVRILVSDTANKRINLINSIIARFKVQIEDSVSESKIAGSEMELDLEIVSQSFNKNLILALYQMTLKEILIK